MTDHPPLLRRLPVNASGRDFFIGDLHGCTDLLHAALRAVRFQEDRDRVISVGDLIDHGPDSFGAVELLTKPWFHAVLGNHEAMALAFHGRLRRYYSRDIWMYNGGTWSLTLDAAREAQMIDAFTQLPLALEIPQRDGRVIGVLHAELLYGAPWSSLQHLDRDRIVADDDAPRRLESGLLWARRQAQVNAFLLRQHTLDAEQQRYFVDHRQQVVGAARRTPGIDLLIAGHTMTLDGLPFAIENRLLLDTGAGKAGVLTLAEPMANRYWQARWRKDGRGAVKKVVQRPLPVPIRAWEVRARLRAAIHAAGDTP